MPELPEVESIRLGLEKYLIGHIIESIEVRWTKSFRGKPEWIAGGKVTGVRRFAKVLSIDLSNAYSLLIHVKMTGQLIYQGPKLPHQVLSKKSAEVGGKHTHVVFTLDRSARMSFSDTRKFGWIEVVKTQDVLQFPFIANLGPEPFAGLTFDVFARTLGNAKTPIKLLLMDQGKIGGIGNIYANDALWLAKVHPMRPANSLTTSEQKKLFDAVMVVLRKGIELGGASEFSYIRPDGSEGKYQEHFLVYGKAGEPCSRCRTTLQKISLGGRGTYFCSKCQTV